MSITLPSIFQCNFFKNKFIQSRNRYVPTKCCIDRRVIGTFKKKKKYALFVYHCWSQNDTEVCMFDKVQWIWLELWWWPLEYHVCKHRFLLFFFFRLLIDKFGFNVILQTYSFVGICLSYFSWKLFMLIIKYDTMKGWN